jgi:insulysin
VHGNYTAAETKALSASITTTLGNFPLPPSQEPVRRSVALEAGFNYLCRQHTLAFNPEEQNSAIENTYLVGPEAGCSDEGTALLNEAVLYLTNHLINEPAFDQLRTKEQLGYIVR